MSGSEASHDINTPSSISIQCNNSTAKPLLTLTDAELQAFDPLTRMAARLMIKNGKAVLVGPEAG